MKSLILKDLYNISYNIKSMVSILLFLAFLQILCLNQAGAFMVTAAILCSMMIVTTFNFDERSGWERYAVIMPVGKSDVVTAKFVVHAIFAVVGVLIGVLAAFVSYSFKETWHWSAENWMEFLATAAVALAIALFYGGTLIPLAIRFGTEKSRMFSVIHMLCLGGGVAAVIGLGERLGIGLSEGAIFGLFCATPVLGFVWNYTMYVMSCRIFERMEVLR